MNNKLDHIHNLVRESVVNLLNKAKYSKCCKHKVLLMGDSHMRGCAARMIASLDARFDVCCETRVGHWNITRDGERCCWKTYNE